MTLRTLKSLVRERESMILSLLVAVSSIGMWLASPALGVGWGDVPRETGSIPWLGCWSREQAQGDREPILGRGEVVCLARGPTPYTLTRTSWNQGTIVSTQTLLLDGKRRRLRGDGCEGWERAQQSMNGRRLYLLAEARCEGGRTRSVSGVWMLSPSDRWIEIQVVSVDGVRNVQIDQRYALSSNTVYRRGVIPMAIETARVAATAVLDVDDVLEALALVDAAVVEVMLLETRPRFPMQSSLLLRLAAADVPARVIDLMLALSFPNQFEIAGDAIRPTPEPVATYSYRYDSYWYGYSHYYPFYYYGYPSWYGHPPSDHYQRGTAINGLGYTTRRISAPHKPSDGSGGGSASVTPSGYTQPSNSSTQSSSSVRKAVRRDDF